MKRCLCVLLVMIEPCLHALGVHTGIEGIAPFAMNYLATQED